MTEVPVLQQHSHLRWAVHVTVTSRTLPGNPLNAQFEACADTGKVEELVPMADWQPHTNAHFHKLDQRLRSPLELHKNAIP